MVEGASFGADELGRYLGVTVYGGEEGEGVSEGEGRYAGATRRCTTIHCVTRR